MGKEELRQQASISILNSLLETTQHSILESVAIKDIYAHVAVLYADALIDALEVDKEGIEKWITTNSILFKDKIEKLWGKQADSLQQKK
jgi:hypothetical protein